MGITKLSELNAAQGRCYIAGDLPTSSFTYYATSVRDVDSKEWKGGEIAYNTRDNRFYVQTATSGTTATWKRLLEQTVSA